MATADSIPDPAAPIRSPKRSRTGSGKRKKTIAVTSRYDENEFRELDEAASSAGLTRASYQRVQSLAEPSTRSTRRPPIEKELLSRVLGQLGKAGGNLNQVAKAVNTNGAEVEVINAVILEVRAAAREVQQVLGRTE